MQYKITLAYTCQFICIMYVNLPFVVYILCIFLRTVYFQMLASIRDCFVTGKWEEDKDAATLLKEDGKKTKCRLCIKTHGWILTTEML